jgi:hypothetical protein
MLERLSDPADIGDPDDPAAVRRWMGRMGKEMGEEAADEFDELVESEEVSQDTDMYDEGSGFLRKPPEA